MQYFEKERFYNDLSAFQEHMSDCQLSASAMPSQLIGEQLMKIADNMLKSHNFAGYSKELKEDMKSFALYKMTRGLMTYNLEYGPSKTFSYFTRACYLAYLTEIAKHYKQVNLVRKMTYDRLVEMGASDQLVKMFQPYQPRNDLKSLQFNHNRNRKSR